MDMTNVVALHAPCDGDGADSELSTSVSKAMALLTGFTAERREMGVSELARATGLPKSTAFRLLATLVSWGLLERCGTRYSLGRRVSQLAGIVSDVRQHELREAAAPYLMDLYELTRETIHLAIPDGADVLYIEKLFGHNQVRSPSRVGGRLNAACSALGKAMLAYSEPEVVVQVVRQLRPLTRYTIVTPSALAQELQTIRENGVAFDREEAALGLTCVAAPIRSRSGKVLGAVSVSGPTSRFDPARKAAAVRSAAAGIAHALPAAHHA
jgi:DNA-binding IclR family transcriptional regulator